MDREGLRIEYAAYLRTAVPRRFGAARAQELARAIDDVAGWLTEVATFPVGADDQPAFYGEPEP